MAGELADGLYSGYPRGAADIADSVCRSVCGDCDDPLGRISSSAHGLHHRISAGFHGSGRRL